MKMSPKGVLLLALIVLLGGIAGYIAGILIAIVISVLLAVATKLEMSGKNSRYEGFSGIARFLVMITMVLSLLAGGVLKIFIGQSIIYS